MTNTTAPEVGRTQDLVAYKVKLAALNLGRTPYTFETSPDISYKLSDYSLRKGLLLFYKESLYNAKPHTLRPLKQRAEWLHAQLEIKSSPAGGTELSF